MSETHTNLLTRSTPAHADSAYEAELEQAEAELTRLAGNWRADEDARTAAQDALNNAYRDGISPESWAEAAYTAVWGGVK